MLWSERDYTSSAHIIYGQLLKAKNSTPRSDRLVKIDINGTVYELETNGTGYFKLFKEFQPLNGSSTLYNIVASYDGLWVGNATLNTTTPYGEEYAVCTTMHYVYRPSSNSTSLIVRPMAATAALFVSICVGIAALVMVPEPSSIVFKLVFPWISLLFAAIALNIIGLWS